MDKEKQKIVSDICPYYKKYGTCEQCNTELDIDDAPCYFECMANAIIENGYKKTEWISADERLPMYGELVLVSSIDKITKKHGWFYLASYDKERKWWNGALLGRVTHWMPLPEPPKGV